MDKVEISIIDEVQPRWLSFLGNDRLMCLPAQFANQAIPNNKLAPNLVRRAFRIEALCRTRVDLLYFNMENPHCGRQQCGESGLRRAIALAYNTEEEIRLPRRNQAIAAQGVIPPNTWG